jgi:hypothetical protein
VVCGTVILGGPALAQQAPSAPLPYGMPISLEQAKNAAAAAEAEAKRLRVGSAAVRTAPATSNGATSAPSASAARGSSNGRAPAEASVGAAGAPAATVAPPRQKLPKLSKDAYKRQKATVEAELTRLGLRKNHLEMAIGSPATAANFVELRRMTSELADVDTALNAVEEQWLELEERAP